MTDFQIPEPAFSRDESWFKLVGFIQSMADLSDIAGDILDYADMLEQDRLRPITQWMFANGLTVGGDEL